MELPKSKADLLISKLQQCNLLESDVKVFLFRDRQKDLASFFLMKGDRVYCSDIAGLVATLMVEHDPDECRLFPYPSKTNLKAFLLHSETIVPSIPGGQEIHMKGDMRKHEEAIMYERYHWHLSSDWKVFALLLDVHGGYTHCNCLLCKWDSMTRES